MSVSVVRAGSLHPPYRTAEDRSGEVFYLTQDAGLVSLSAEGEGKQTGGLYAVSRVRPTDQRVCPAELGSDLSDVALSSGTGRIWLSRW